MKGFIIPQRGLALVEVTDPWGRTKKLTYRASESVSIGQSVRVPAPDWLERATGHDALDGTVVGEGEAHVSYELRDILPSAPVKPKVTRETRELAAEWRKAAVALRAEADTYDSFASALEEVL